MDNTIRITGKIREAVKLPMCGKDSQGGRSADRKYNEA